MNLVALGDSTPNGYGLDKNQSYVHIYASYIKEDLKIDVIVHNWSTNETQTVSNWVEKVRNNEELREDLRKADVITIWLGWHSVIPSIIKKGEDSDFDLLEKPNFDRLHKVIVPMQESFDNLLFEISSLAPPTETLILIADVGIPSFFVSKWKEYGTFDVWYRHAYKVWRDYIIQSGNKYSIHIVPTHKVINGPNKDQSLPTKFLQSDGIHFNEEGHKLIADVHRKIGYKYSSP